MNEGRKLQIGDLVYVRNFGRKKLEPYFTGPFRVVKLQFNTDLSDVNTNILLNRKVHFKNIIKY